MRTHFVRDLALPGTELLGDERSTFDFHNATHVRALNLESSDAEGQDFTLTISHRPDRIINRLKRRDAVVVWPVAIPANHAMTCALADADKDSLEAYLLAH